MRIKAYETYLTLTQQINVQTTNTFPQRDPRTPRLPIIQHGIPKSNIDKYWFAATKMIILVTQRYDGSQTPLH